MTAAGFRGRGGRVAASCNGWCAALAAQVRPLARQGVPAPWASAARRSALALPVVAVGWLWLAWAGGTYTRVPISPRGQARHGTWPTGKQLKQAPKVPSPGTSCSLRFEPEKHVSHFICLAAKPSQALASQSVHGPFQERARPYISPARPPKPVFLASHSSFLRAPFPLLHSFTLTPTYNRQRAART